MYSLFQAIEHYDNLFSSYKTYCSDVFIYLFVGFYYVWIKIIQCILYLSLCWCLYTFIPGSYIVQTLTIYTFTGRIFQRIYCCPGLHFFFAFNINNGLSYLEHKSNFFMFLNKQKKRAFIYLCAYIWSKASTPIKIIYLLFIYTTLT